jgi:hypothetical protein
MVMTLGRLPLSGDKAMLAAVNRADNYNVL